MVIFPPTTPATRKGVQGKIGRKEPFRSCADSTTHVGRAVWCMAKVRFVERQILV